MKVIGLGEKKARKSLSLQCKTSIGNNSGSIKARAVFCVQHGVFGYGGPNDVTAIFVA